MYTFLSYALGFDISSDRPGRDKSLLRRVVGAVLTGAVTSVLAHLIRLGVQDIGGVEVYYAEDEAG